MNNRYDRLKKQARDLAALEPDTLELMSELFEAVDEAVEENPFNRTPEDYDYDRVGTVLGWSCANTRTVRQVLAHGIETVARTQAILYQVSDGILKKGE